MKKITFLFPFLLLLFISQIHSQSLVAYCDFESSSSFFTYSSGANIDYSCGSAYGSYACYFNSSYSTPRYMETIDFNMASGGYLSFYLYLPSSTYYTYCDSPESGEDVYLQYSTNGGSTWNTMGTYYAGYNLYDYFVQITVNVPSSAYSSATRFRWKQIYFTDYGYDNWAIDELYIYTSGCSLSFSNGADSQDRVDGITLNSINTVGYGFVSGSMYTDNTSIYTSLVAGKTYTLTVYGSGSNYETFGAWIDYNHNSNYSDPGELLGVAKSSGGKGTMTFTVPSSVSGSSVLRVLSQEDYSTSSLDPCGSYTYGEVEDYTIVFTTGSGIEETNAENNFTVYPNPTS